MPHQKEQQKNRQKETQEVLELLEKIKRIEKLEKISKPKRYYPVPMSTPTQGSTEVNLPLSYR